MESPAVPPTASDVASTFRAVMRSYAATVTIVTASDGGRRHGIKVAMLPFGIHAIVIGEVDEVGLGDTAEPLLYCDATYCISVPARA
jgi:flavin reductase (DIM6/NTAB) family NADH-FMN oxidoreductase RutF